MPISFEQIPTDVRTPGNFVEIDPTGAVESAGIRPHTILVIAYRSSTGSVAENIPKQVTSDPEAEGNWGPKSQMAATIRAARNANSRTPLWGIGVDPAVGTAATGTFTITGTATGSGTAQFYIGGKRYPVGVSVGDTATAVGDALEAAVTADSQAQVSASNLAGVVTITYEHAGPEGNDIDLQINFRDRDVTPLGLTVVVAAMASGATSPDLTATLAALAGTQFDTVITGITDAANLALIEAELDTRWGPMVNLDGHLFSAFVDNLSNSLSYTVAPNFNSFQHSIVTPGLTPTPPWIVAANVGAIDAFETIQDPARPRQTLVLPDVVAPKAGQRFEQSERDLLLRVGAATTTENASGQVAIERLTTTRQQNDQGIPDPTWLDIMTKRTASFLRWDWDARITLKYPRHKLADDGTRFGPGQNVMTPNTLRGEAISWFEEKEFQGLVEGLDQFREELVIERNISRTVTDSTS